MKNVVILGAGFGGLRTAIKLEAALKRLHHADEWSIVLIDKNTYHSYTPALYEAASAYRCRGIKSAQKFEESLGGSVSLPLHDLLGGRNITFVQGEVCDVDFWKNEVKLNNSDTISYEYLVFALGSENVYFGIEGARRCCYALKTLQDAFRIRRRIEEIFSQKRREEPVRIVSVGAGATGVETVAEIATYTRHLAKDYGLDYKNIRILLIEARDKILASSAKSQRDAVQKRLGKLGVVVRTNTRVREVMPECVMFEGGSKCDADIILWGGGIKGPALFAEIGRLELDKSGRILVDKFLQAKGLRKVFAVGDNAEFVDTKTGISAPATAFNAEWQADIAAENIIRAASARPLLEYEISIPGYVISCGGKYAVARIYGITLAGFFGWAVKKLIDLKYFFSILSPKEAMFLWLRELRIFTKND